MKHMKHNNFIVLNNGEERWTVQQLAKVARQKREMFLDDGDRRAFRKLANLCVSAEYYAPAQAA